MKFLWLWVGIGGFLGSICRWWLYQLFHSTPDGFPLSTFLANIAGSFLIGLFAGLFLLQPQLSRQAFLITGFCGGFTTFSAFSMDTLQLLQHGQTTVAFFYATASIVCGVAATFAGYWLMR